MIKNSNKHFFIEKFNKKCYTNATRLPCLICIKRVKTNKKISTAAAAKNKQWQYQTQLELLNKNQVCKNMKKRTAKSCLIPAMVILCICCLSSGATQTKEAFAEQDFFVAKGMFQDQLYDLAAAQFKDFIQNHPQSRYKEEAQFLLAECNFFAENYNQAISAYRHLLTHYPAVGFRDKANFRIGEAMVHSQRYDRAINLFKSFIDEYPQSDLLPQVYYWYAEALYRSGDSKNALFYYAKVIKHDPQNKMADYALFSAGYIYEKRQQYDKALEAYTKLIQTQPNSTLKEQAGYRKGFAAFGKKDYNRAIDFLSSALKQYPQSDLKSEAQYFIGESFFKNQDYSKAIQAYKIITAIAQNEFADDAQYSLAWTYHTTQDYQKAAQAFIKAAQISRDSELVASSFFQAGRNYKRIEQRRQAKKAFYTVFHDYKESKAASNALYEFASILFTEKKYDNALQHYTMLLQNYPDAEIAAEASVMKGECYLAMNRFDKAETAFRHSFDQFDKANSKANALFKIAWIQFQNGDYQNALENLNAVIRAFSSHAVAADALFWKGETLYKLQRFEESAQCYSQFIKKHPNHSRSREAYYGLGYVSIKLDDFATAIQAFSKLTSDDSEMAIDALLRKGDALFSSKAYDQAISAYQDVLRKEAASNQLAEATYQIGQSYYKMQNFDLARDYFLQVKRNFHNSQFSPLALYAGSRAAFRQDQFHLAIQDLQALLNTFPNSNLQEKAIYALGDCYYNLKDYDKAAHYYRTIIDQYPQSDLLDDAVTGLQWALVQQNKSNQALSVIDTLVNKLSDKNKAADILANKADFYANSQNYENAIQQYQTLLDDYPQSDAAQNAYYQIALCYKHLGKDNEMLVALENQYRNFPNARDTPDAYLQTASYLKSKEQFGQAIQVYRQLLSEYPDHELAGKALCDIGLIHLHNEDFVQAQTVFNKALNRETTTEIRNAASIGLATTYIEIKRFPKAIDLLEDVLKTSDSKAAAQAQFLLGKSYAGQQNDQEAIVAYLKTKYLYGSERRWVAKSIYHAGECNEKLGRYSDARRLYQSILNEYSDQDELVQKARKRINDLIGK